MTRYEDCRRHLQAYLDGLRASPKLNPSSIETLVRAHVEQPAYDQTFREQLVRDVLQIGETKDAFDQWWEWAEKPVESMLMIPAEIHFPVMALSPEDRRDREKVNAAVRNATEK
jgi:hypothetical protein